jgi:serine/threonine protein kinase
MKTVSPAFSLTKIQMEPKYVAEGTYGCVLAPAVNCRKKVNTTKVSKVFIKNTAAKEEENIQNIIKTIDPKNEFTVKMSNTCSINIDSFPQAQTDKCKRLGKTKETTSVFNQIVYENGGDSLQKVIKYYNFEDVVMFMEPLFYGLTVLEKKMVCHMDIKPANIVFNASNNKMSLIDFGLSHSYKTMFHDNDNMSVIGSQYEYFPLEMRAVYEEYMDPSFLSKKQTMINIGQSLIRVLGYVPIVPIHTLRDVPEFAAEWYKTIQMVENYDKYIGMFFQQCKRKNSTIRDMCTTTANKVDVYSLGVTLFELFCRCAQMQHVNIKRYQLFYTRVFILIRYMIHPNPLERPTPKQAYAFFLETRKALMSVKPRVGDRNNAVPGNAMKKFMSPSDRARLATTSKSRGSYSR